MTRSKLAKHVNRSLVALCGEQYESTTDSRGDIWFKASWAGVQVGLIVEAFGAGGAMVAGHHVVGARVEDRAAAMEFVAARNQRLRVGRLALRGDCVIFFHHLFGCAVNTDSLRCLLNLLASESRSYANLAAAAGALRASDIADLGPAAGPSS